MQKFYSIFPKGKRRQFNIYSPCDAFPTDQITQKNIFKHYEFDSDCLNNTKFDCRIMLNSKTDDSKKSQGFDVFSSDLVSDIKNDLKLAESDLTSNFSKSGSVVSHHSAFSLSEREGKKYSSEKKSKSRRNMYVINISNSKYFHIGPQKTININEKQLSRRISQPCVDDNDLRKLLDCEEKLTEECITLISLHLHNQWKDFIKYLGLEDTILETLELRNDYVRSFVVYDALQEYMNLFPNTSIGFIINGLHENHQMPLIEMLAQELNSRCI